MCLNSSVRELGRSSEDRKGKQISAARTKSQVVEPILQKNSDHLIVARKQGNSCGAKRMTVNELDLPLPLESTQIDSQIGMRWKIEINYSPSFNWRSGASKEFGI